MNYIEYSFRYAQNTIEIKSTSKLSTALLESIADFIEEYSRELALSNISSSARRFNDAPQEFPIVLNPFFIDYLSLAFETVLFFNKTNDIFQLNKVVFTDIIKIDPLTFSVVKKKHFTVNTQLLFTSILLEFITDYLSEESSYFETSYKNMRIVKNLSGKKGYTQLTKSFSFPGSFGQKDASYSYNYTISHNQLPILHFFCDLEFDSEKNLLEQAATHEIDISKIS